MLVCERRKCCFFLKKDIVCFEKKKKIKTGMSAASFCGIDADTLTFDKTLFVVLTVVFSVLVLLVLIGCSVLLRRAKKQEYVAIN
jgi:hypothetical protein